MEIEPLEIFARDSNYAVIKPPGRRYPGCVIQGDTLAGLCCMAQQIAHYVEAANIRNDDLLENVQDLNNALVGRMLHYQDVLAQHGIEFPHVHPFSKQDMVRLLPDDDGRDE